MVLTAVTVESMESMQPLDLTTANTITTLVPIEPEVEPSTSTSQSSEEVIPPASTMS